MKRVIFVCGTSFSGSTLLDMILANDPKGFSCGEVSALFRPVRPHHFNPDCGCGDGACEIWRKILPRGENLLYETIFDLYGVDFIVDSSKDLFWSWKHSKLLPKKNIAVENILIWKTPLESAQSYKKRKRLDEWEKAWISYHRSYFTIFSAGKTIRYSELTRNKHALKNLCRCLEIPYFSDKGKYWEKTHHTLFGNTTAKIHLYPPNSEKVREYEAKVGRTANGRESNVMSTHQSIYYKPIVDKSLIQFVEKKRKENQHFGHIMNILDNNGTMCPYERRKRLREIELPWYILGISRLKSSYFRSLLSRLHRQGLP